MKHLLFAVFLGICAQTLYAQELTIGFELRPRFEFRNGFNTMMDGSQDPATFLSQRSRLNLNFIHDKLTLAMRVQDVRVWGDVATNQSNVHKGLALFEGYARYQLDSIWSFKVGRQVLSYDNQRILGALDWSQQGRSHDAFLISIDPDAGHHFDLAFSVSAVAESNTKIPYPVNNYKNLQLLRYQHAFGTSRLSVLALNTGFDFENAEAESTTQYLQTFGIFYHTAANPWTVEVSAYGQMGKRNGKNTKAYYGAASLGFSPNEAWHLALGGEYLSGTAMDDGGETNKSFDPLFGTNHKFNGHMGYFYGGNHFGSVGLVDLYAQAKYEKNKFQLEASPHVFYAAASMMDAGNNTSRYLGTEVDFAMGYQLHKAIMLHLGYSQYFGTEALELLKNGNAERAQYWVWAMATIKPEAFKL